MIRIKMRALLFAIGLLCFCNHLQSSDVLLFQNPTTANNSITDTLFMEFNKMIIGERLSLPEYSNECSMYMEITPKHLLVLTTNPILFSEQLWGENSFQTICDLYSYMHIERDDFHSIQDEAPYLVTLNSSETKVIYIMNLPDTTYSIMNAVIRDSRFTIGNVHCGDTITRLDYVIPLSLIHRDYHCITMLYPMFLTTAGQQRRHIYSSSFFTFSGGADAITYWIKNGIITKIQVGSIWQFIED